jgi:hypothetical protein
MLAVFSEFIAKVFGQTVGLFYQLLFIIGAILRDAFGHPKFVDVAQEFFTEAAVLVFVFPVLDTVVQFGARKVTWKLALGSVGVAVFLLFWAGILARRKS